MASPNLELYTTGDVAVTEINFGSSGQAGDILPTSTGVLYYLWNDKGGVSTSDTALNIKARVRDADGGEDDEITTQQWIEIQSTTLHAGSTGASTGSYTDDNMSGYMPIGGDTYCTIGGIPSDCYRKIYLRCNVPPSATQQTVSFSIYFDYQDPSAAIANWITGVHGNGIISSTGSLIEVTDSTSTGAVDIEIADGRALINNNEVTVYAQTYTLSTSSGTYAIYLTNAGVISNVSTTGSIPSNAIPLAEVTISAGSVSTVTDKRVFIGNVMAGSSGAASTAPDIGDVFLATTGTTMYVCYSSGTWTEYTGSTGSANAVESSGAMTSGNIVQFASTGGVISDGGIAVTDLIDKGDYTTSHCILATTGTSGSVAAISAATGTILGRATGTVAFLASTSYKIDDFGAGDDNTDLNASTSAHGLLPKRDGTATNFLSGAGTWGTPTFVGLSDTPVSFTSGSASQLLRVNSSTNAVEFVSATGLALDGFGEASTGTALNATSGHHGLLPALQGTTNAVLVGDGTWSTSFSGSTGGGSTVTTFLELTDSPAAYTSAAGYLLRVNSSTDAVEFASSTAIAITSFGVAADTTGHLATTSNPGLLIKLTNSTSNYLLADGTWAAVPGSTGGEVNTAANASTEGTGVYLEKSGVELRFRTLLSTGSVISIAASTSNTINFNVLSTGSAATWLDGTGVYSAPTASEVGALYSSGAFTANTLAQISSTDGVLKASPVAITTGSVINFGLHSAGFTEQSSTATTGTATINWSLGNKVLYTRSTDAGGACTIEFTDPPKSMSVMLIIRGSTAGSTGAVAWSTGNTIHWSSTAVPTFSTGVSSVDVVGLYYSTGLSGYLAMDKTTFSTI